MSLNLLKKTFPQQNKRCWGKNKKTVYVGLSGGVDSAVSAGLLKEQGFNVIGVFIKIWSPEWINCTAKEDRLDAMRVCATLGIQYKEIDLSEEYKKQVVQNIIYEYKSGRTPNPDVLCNKEIKFGKFFDFAMREGADYVATGHYARVHNPSQPPSHPAFGHPLPAGEGKGEGAGRGRERRRR